MLAGIAAASVQGVAALGERAGARLRRLGDPDDEDETSAPGRCHVVDPAVDFDPAKSVLWDRARGGVPARQADQRSPRSIVIASAVIRPGRWARVRQSALWPPVGFAGRGR